MTNRPLIPVTEPTSGHLLDQDAPEFMGTDTHGARLGRGDLHGSPALLVFFPFAFTYVCGQELTELNAALEHFEGIRIVAISCDPMATQRAWSEQQGFRFDLICDFWPHGDIARAFGVFDAVMGRAVRASFLLDSEGTVRWSLLHPSGEPRPLAAYLHAIKEPALTRQVAP